MTALARVTDDLRKASGQWGFGNGAAIRLLAVSENMTFLVREGARSAVVRVSRPGYHDDGEAGSELDWIEALGEAGVVRTAKPIPASDGQRILRFGDAGQHRAVAFEQVRGREPAVDHDLPDWFRHLGGITARLHGHARTWSPPAGFRRKLWNFGSILGPGAFWGDWRRAPGLDEAGLAVLERVGRRLEAETAAIGQAPDRFGLVHCDLRLTNLLVEGGGMSVIDFDDCGFCWFAYDFAAAISFIEHEPIVPRLRAAWLEGYREVAAFSEDQARTLPVLVMLRRMQLTAWIASHAESPTAEALGTGFVRGTVRLGLEYLASPAGAEPL